MRTYEKLYSILEKHNYRVTAARKLVYTILASAAHPLNKTEIINRATEIDKASVYRTLELFDALGITHKVWNGFKSKVELSDPYSPHHHHFTCTACGTVMSFKSKEVEQELGSLERSLRATIHTHLVEISGLCQQCSRNVTAS